MKIGLNEKVNSFFYYATNRKLDFSFNQLKYENKCYILLRNPLLAGWTRTWLLF